MELTPEQQKHLDSIRWLINGPRASGKTTVLAIALLEKAEIESDMKVSIFDHDGTILGKKYMIRAIAEIAHQVGLGDRLEIIQKDFAIRIRSKKESDKKERKML